METKLKPLRSVFFAGSLLLLLVNDLFLKSLFPGFVTGKLSDVAGIFVFAFFWATLFPKYVRYIIPLIGGLFILWKLPLSDGFIQFWNNYSVLPIARVVDYTDLFALLILPLAYVLFQRRESLSTIRISPLIPLLLSVFAFSATSYPRRVIGYNKQTYYFDVSQQELVNRINTIVFDTTREKIPVSLHHENTNAAYHFWGIDSLIPAYAPSFEERSDTLFDTSTGAIDTIYNYTIPTSIDTLYIDKKGNYYISLPVGEYVKEKAKKNYCTHVPAHIILTGDSVSSQIKLVSFIDHGCRGFFFNKDDEEKAGLLEGFEKEFIQRLQDID